MANNIFSRKLQALVTQINESYFVSSNAAKIEYF